MEWCVLRPKKNPTSSAAALPHTQKCNLVFCFSHCWMFVAGSTEGVCSFRQWGNVGLPLCILCLNPFFPTSFPTPSSFPLTSSAWGRFAQTLSGPVFLYLAGSCTCRAIMCHTCIQLPTSLGKQADSGVQYLLTRVIYSLFCSLPWHLSFSHSLQ